MRAFFDSGSWVFVLGAALMWVANQPAPEWVDKIFDTDPLLSWFLCVLAVVVIPLGLAAGLVLRQEGTVLESRIWRDRLRFRPMTSDDWRATLIAVGAVALGSAPIAAVLLLAQGEESFHPPFMGGVPLGDDRLWLLLAWFPFWVVNIMGEEILWRGIIQPKQITVYGSRGWMMNSLGWAIFHLAFGWKLMLMLIPILVVLPWTVQRTSNTWTGVVIHAVLNGPSFIAISVGIV